MTAVLLTLVLSVVLCGLYERFARARQILDTPNERSSHILPTPHGGGVALLAAFVLGLILAAALDGGWAAPLVTLTACTLILALVGVVDDLRSLSVRWRLLTYAIVCLFAAATLLYGANTGGVFIHLALLLCAAFILLWSLNLYNFMDGIDGIAALQAVFICTSAAFLTWLAGHDDSYVRYCLILAAAHGGFLAWNAPPARLFMGDAGSVPTGFLLAALALLGAVQGQLDPLCWLVLSAVFVTDASWTLGWRMISGENFTEPHRSHAYQRLSRHWNSHLRVDLLLLAINVLWLFPLALAVQMWPDYKLFLVFLAYLPLLCGMVKVGRVA
ncbi:putative undecaprenyl-phosphate N-acetylglucosaminyl 1-phosphate transferase [Halioglobus japonicus]|nr:putative undecaprenyl-phosphate N-acetylglucosaminyl 1-phosphate transferase [Halioglobus japonicus]